MGKQDLKPFISDTQMIKVLGVPLKKGLIYFKLFLILIT